MWNGFLCYICKYWHETVWKLLANRSYERSVSASSQQDGLRPVELSCCYLTTVSPLGWTSPNITHCTIWLQTKLLCFQWVMSCISYNTFTSLMLLYLNLWTLFFFPDHGQGKIEVYSWNLMWFNVLSHRPVGFFSSNIESWHTIT